MLSRDDAGRWEQSVEIRLLGSFQLVRDGVVTAAGRVGERALLALLAARPGRTFANSELIDALWEQGLPGRPDNALQVRVSRLRRVIGSALVTEPSGYRLDIAADAVDVVRFERLIAERRFADALELWRGPPLAEFVEYGWARAEARRLQELRATAIEEHVDVRLAAGDHVALVSELAGLVAAFPLRERLRGQLMLALYRCGRAADALAAYRGFRKMLEQELGVEPSAMLRQLEVAILREDRSLEAPPSGPPARVDLPRLLTPVLGRQEQVEQLLDLLRRSPLVTLTGPGGVGKTTLALAAAHEAAPRYRDGVWFVPFAPVREPALIPDAIAHAVGLSDPDAASARRLVMAWLSARHGLLVLDNCEHLVDACADFVDELQRSSGQDLRMIATSREPLAIPGELQMPVPPLALREAVRLFAQRATSVRPDFELAGEEEDVQQICERLDGLPLAIELAAARVNVLPASEISTRLSDRFRLLTTAPRTADARHQTLRATVDWSYALLSAGERRLFRRLAVFHGGWTLDAAGTVCGDEESLDVLDLLSRLVDRSLVVAGGGRFHLLETIQAYAASRLEEAGEQADVAERHARFFTALAEAAGAGLRGAEQNAWLQRLRADEANLRLALAWAADHRLREPDLGVRLAGALGWYWYVGRQVEGRRYLNTILEAAPPAASAATARALQARSLLLRPVGCIVHPHAEAARAAAESARLFDSLGDHPQAAISRLLVAVEGVTAEDVGPALGRVAAARTTLQAAGHGWGSALADFVEMELRLHHGEVNPALALGEAAFEAFDALDDAWGRSAVLLHLGFGLRVAGRIDEAEHVLARAVTLSRDGGLPNNLARSLAELGEAALHRGDGDVGDRWFAECGQVAEGLANDTLSALAFLGRAGTARLRGDTAMAQQLFEEALRLSIRNGYGKGIARARCGLAATRLDLAGDQPDVVEELQAVLEQTGVLHDAALTATVLEQLSRAATAEGRTGEAVALLHQADAVRAEHTRPRGVLEDRDAAEIRMRAAVRPAVS